MLARVAEHGFDAVLLTVDLPVGGRREREQRHLDVPFPDGVALASHLGHDLDRRHSAIGGWDASLTWADVAWVRDASGLPVIVKGILCAEDADAALDAGADAIVVSNHGGRQVDGCVPTAVALREVAAAVAGRVPVLVDGGIRDGADVLRALALGAERRPRRPPVRLGPGDAAARPACAPCSTRSPRTSPARSRWRAARRSPRSTAGAFAHPAGDAISGAKSEKRGRREGAKFACPQPLDGRHDGNLRHLRAARAEKP